MSKGVGVEAWGGFPLDPRTNLWPEIMLVVPLLSRDAANELLAGKRVILPRVPVPGEQVDVAGRWASVNEVRWQRDRPAFVRTEPLPTDFAGLIDALEADGFSIKPVDDADDWLSRQDSV